MLQDSARTKAYHNAISKNSHLFQDKNVLDVGCGTGILSIFAAKAGARHVYAVENAEISIYAEKIVETNKLSEKITIINGKIENIVLPVEKVDIIISEWMGYFMLSESMLDSVIIARDRFLIEGGLMFPDKAVLYISSIEDQQYKDDKVGFWDDVYGIDMSCIKEPILKLPIIEAIQGTQVNGNNTVILDLDLQTVKLEDLEFSNEYEIKIQRDDKVHAFVGWFDVMFTKGNNYIILSTSPFRQETHWKQVTFYTDELKVFRGDTIKGSIAVWKSKDNPRELEVKFSLHIENKAQTNDSLYQYHIN